jgi:hypothetical protein
MSPARNRVTPMGDIEAIPLRGAWTGNRGILHSGHEIVRFHASDLGPRARSSFVDVGVSNGSRVTTPLCTSTTRPPLLQPGIDRARSAGATATTLSCRVG